MSRTRTAGQRPLGIAALVAVALTLACGGTVTDETGSSNSDPPDASGVSGSPGDDDASVAPGSAGTPGATLGTGGRAGSPQAGGAPAALPCGASRPLESAGILPPPPPTILFALQRSLVGEGPDGPYFDTVVSALDRFARNANTTFTRLAIGVFPAPEWVAGGACVDPACLQLRSLNFPIPAAAQGLVQSLLEVDLSDATAARETPVACVAEAMLPYAERATLVLVADGSNTGCAELEADFPSKGEVHVVAIPTEKQDLSRLDAIATSERLYAFFDPPSVAELVETFEGIRERTQPAETLEALCRYQLPDFGSGSPLDPGTVNVLLTQNGFASPLAYVASARDCEPGLGWYYDDPENPSFILGCPETCFAVSSGAYLQAQTGCVDPVKPR